MSIKKSPAASIRSASPEPRLKPCIVCSRFVVANGMQEAVAAAFRIRPHEVDSVDGFIRMEVLRPSDHPEEFWLMTWWRDSDAYHVWHRSHAYRDSHKGIPKGLKLRSGEQSITLLEQISE